MIAKTTYKTLWRNEVELREKLQKENEELKEKNSFLIINRCNKCRQLNKPNRDDKK